MSTMNFATSFLSPITNSTGNLLIVISAAAILSAFHIGRKYFQAQLPPPPGPSPLPFIGNIHQLPRNDQAFNIAKWTKVHGDVIYMRVFSRELVFLNSAKAVLDLFHHRSAIYSARPHLIMAGDLVGRASSILFRQYDDILKTHRMLLHHALNQRRIADYEELLEVESLRLMSALEQRPADFISHLRRNAGSISLSIAYGYKVNSYSGPDHFIHLSEESARILTEASEPGKWLVDSFPWLKFIPEWFPGAYFKKWARIAREQSEEFVDVPYLFTKQLINEGKGSASFTSEATELLERESGQTLTKVDEHVVKWTAAGIYAGGSDTTVALTTAFILYMVLFPEVQEKAQAEIDAVVGTERLPSLQDQERMPYIDALIKECHRFNPIVPFIPHSCEIDDEYRGFKIPKGAWIMANSCAIMHDPKEFPQPERFWPERYLVNKSSIDPRDYSFGFGRRRCPGISLANASIFIVITNILALFRITAPRDTAGRPCPPKLAFTSGHVSHPEHFEADIKPRSPQAVSLMNQLLLSKGEAMTRV